MQNYKIVPMKNQFHVMLKELKLVLKINNNVIAQLTLLDAQQIINVYHQNLKIYYVNL